MKKKFILSVLSIIVFSLTFQSVSSQETGKDLANQNSNPYLCEDDWIEVMFAENSSVRLRSGSLIDYATDALNGVDQTLDQFEWFTWYRICDVPEDIIDQWSVNGERNTGKPVYNMNNIYRLQIPKGYDIWELSKSLENLSGIMLARPVPKPMELPLPPNYQPQQGYLNPASSSPTGIDAIYAWTQTGGTGTGVTICDLEYSWNYNHADISKAAGSQINSFVQDPFSDNNHGTAVIGELVADNNGWGTTGICYGSSLKTCGTYYGSPSATWNVPGAMAVAIAALSQGDIILLEQQWEYTSGSSNYIPIEWWTNYSPNAQTNNGVYSAIVNAISNGIHVVEAGGNGSVNTDGLTWFGNSGAIIVGAGGAYTGGTWPNGDLQKLAFSSYGSRFDLQGWGENVVTTGYGDLYSAEGVNYYYTSTFSGTSSASPIVAGALACAEGYYLANVSATPPTPSYMRSHLKTYGTPQVTPPAGNIGPRPDLYATIQNFPPPTQNYDWGDAPDPTYPTLAASNGAFHLIGNLYLGALIDAESDGIPTVNADGDDNNGSDDEDGVVFNNILSPGGTTNITVTASASGYLQGWIDFDNNGTFDIPADEVFIDVPLNPGTNNLSFVTPTSAMIGITYARFRFSSFTGLIFYGYCSDGEVEDYEVLIKEEQAGIKWEQLPDLSPTGMDVDATWQPDDPGNPPLILADDFECTVSGNITDIHIWGSWLNDELPFGEAPEAVEFTFSIHSDIPAGVQEPWSMPGDVLWMKTWTPTYDDVEWIYSGPEDWYNPSLPIWLDDNHFWCYKYNCILDPSEYFFQEGTPEQPIVYWLDVQAVPLDPDMPFVRFGWKTSLNHWNDDAVWGIGHEPFMGPWYELRYPDGHEYYDESIDLAFVITTEEEPQDEFDFGDAPEGNGAIAYPSSGVTGSFPTCITVGALNSYIQHGFGENLAWFGPMVDLETDGNAGTCPGCFPSYDLDECFQDGDAGLLTPDSYTIDASGSVIPCPGATAGSSLGIICNNATWGVDIDIDVTNTMPVDGYINVLFDWNQDGKWQNDPATQCAGIMVHEYVLPDLGIPAGYTGTLSGLLPIGSTFQIGPNAGYVWVRFSITEVMIGLNDWDGSGVFDDGETEDYLLLVEEQGELDWGDAPDSPYPTLGINNGAHHVIIPQIYLGNSIDGEPDGQPDNPALGDDNDILYPPPNDDEDGVVFTSTIIQGQNATVDVVASVPGILNAWFDFDANGSWADPGEHVFVDVSLNSALNNLTYNVPAAAAQGNTFARFRFSTIGGLNFDGSASDGEVEDYQIYIGIQTSDIPIDPDPTGSFVQNEISMALVPGTQPGIPAVLLAAYNDDPYPGGPGLGVSYSTDGGATWIPQQLPYPPDPYSGGFFVDMFDPTATADANGDLYVAQISTDYNWATGPASGLFVHKSTDGGVTWLPPVAIATDGPPVSNPDLNYRFNDRCQIIADIDPASPYYNNLYIVWIKDRGWNVGSPLSDIYFSSSIDGGATWSTNVTINQTIHNMGNMPNPTVASDGTIYVCWMDYNVQTGGTGTIYLNISTDGGVTWLPTDIFVTTVNLPPLRLNGGTDVLAKGAAVIEVSPFNPQELYIVYAEASAAGGDEGDIFFIKSTDGGQNWSALLRVNDDATFNDQVMPWMDVKPNGTIDVTWYDRRNDPLDLDWDVYIAMSTDGGNSFAPNMQVNNLPAPSPNTPSGYWMGEYLGLVVDNTHAYIGFTSSIADLNGDVFFAKTQNPLAEIDFGDAPDPTYPTLLANNGARHNIDGITFLGALIDAEPDGLQDPNALGDDNNNLDDEDGIIFNQIIQGSPAQITVTTSTAGYLQGWMDFNADGDWADPGEQIFTDEYIHFGYTVCLNYLVPVNANIGTTYARFRFSTVGGLSYTGLAPDGEVEDYEVEIIQDPDIKWIQEPCVELPGLHCHDYVTTEYQFIVIADDWLCNGGLVTDLHWWGNYENNLTGSGINYFHLSIHTNDPTNCLPLDPEVWGVNVPLASVNETNTGLINNEGCFIYKYEYFLDIPFEQIEGNTYWLDICAYSNDPTDPAIWRWQESDRSTVPVLCPSATMTSTTPWQSIVWNTPPPTRYSDMAFVITSEEIEQIDFGDAADPTYPTLLANNGARHNIDGITFLGALIDAEPDGLQDPNALGDDNNNLDDEDGVSVTFPLYVGGTGGFSIDASVDGILNVWIDFDGNGSWAEADEHVFIDYSLSAGNNWLFFPVPVNANVGTTYARFRFSSVGGLTYTGLAPDGEVEDHEVIIEGDLDFGDAKDPSYPTLMASNGARHLVNTLVYLGACIDAEPDGLPDPNALGDDNNNLDDEDGVILPSIIVYNQMNTIKIIASVNGYVNAWIDFNQNGNWGDAGEQIFTDQAVSAGNNVLVFNVPASAYFGTTFARFRFNTAGGLTYTGQADDGEVEDYKVEIGEVYKWLQEPDLSDMGMDVDATFDIGGFYPPMILADDFLCDITGPLTRIEIWGSWYHDIKPMEGPGAVTFTLSIHKDIPAEQSPTGYSMPGEVIWIGIFNPYEFMFEPYAMGLMEGWYNPALPLYEPFGDTECWRYIFDLMQAEPFIQEGTPDEPIVYWLDVQAQPLDNNPECRFGWKTSPDHWNDDAVWTIGMEPYMGDWMELRYPEGHPWFPESIDLAFAIYGQEDPFILVDLTAFLEGPYNGSDMNTTLNAAGLIPFNQPYYTDPLAKWYYTGTESFSMIPNTDITDWVLVELRDAPTANLATGATMVDQRAAFVLKDASIVATDGSSPIKFYVNFANNPFVVVWHRNHLGVLSANPMNLIGLGLYAYDFTTPAGQAYLNGQKNLSGTIYGLFGGDGKPDGLIDANDKAVWTSQAGTTGYLESDYNMDTQVDNKDKNDVWVPNIGQGTQVPN